MWLINRTASSQHKTQQATKPIKGRHTALTVRAPDNQARVKENRKSILTILKTKQNIKGLFVCKGRRGDN